MNDWDISEGEWRRRQPEFRAPDPLGGSFPLGTGGAGRGRTGSFARDLAALQRHQAGQDRAWRRIKYGPYPTFAALRAAAKAGGYVGPLDTRSDTTRRLMLRHLAATAGTGTEEGA